MYYGVVHMNFSMHNQLLHLSGCPEINPHRLAKLKRRGCWVPPGFKDSGYIHVLEHLEIGNGHIYEIKKNTASLLCLRSIENGKFGCPRCLR
jgi:hypothetical protein